MKLSNVTQQDLQNCAALVEALTKNARFSDVSLRQQEIIKQSVVWLGYLARDLGQIWQEQNKPIVAANKDTAAVVLNPKNIKKSKPKLKR